jgi:hypothetical protein
LNEQSPGLVAGLAGNKCYDDKVGGRDMYQTFVTTIKCEKNIPTTQKRKQWQSQQQNS